MAKGEIDAARDAYQRSLDIYIKMYGGDHGCVALGYLCLARIPTLHKKKTDRVELYERVLAILDTREDATKLDRLLSEIPELPSVDRLKMLVQRVKAERDKVATAETEA